MRKKLVLIARVLLTLLVLILLLSWVDLAHLLDQLRQADPALIGLAACLLIVQYFISSFRWKQILLADGISHSLLFLTKTYMIGNFMSSFLPSGFGGDFYRVYALRKVNSDTGRSASSVLFDRTSGFFALITISLFASLFLPSNPIGWELLALYAIGVVGFVVLTASAVVNKSMATRWKVLRILGKVLRSFREYTRQPRRLFLILLASFIFQFNIVLTNEIYTQALGVRLPFLYLMVIIPLIYLTTVVPLTINGLGIRESAFVYFFGLMGSTAEEGLAVALLGLGMRYAIGLIGGALLLIEIWRGSRREAPLGEPSQATHEARTERPVSPA